MGAPETPLIPRPSFHVELRGIEVAIANPVDDGADVQRRKKLAKHASYRTHQVVMRLLYFHVVRRHCALVTGIHTHSGIVCRPLSLYPHRRALPQPRNRRTLTPVMFSHPPQQVLSR